MALLKTVHWRFRCPKQIDGVAKDFVEWISRDIDPSNLDFDSAFVEFHDPWFAWRRMIATRYGIASNYRSPNGVPAKPAWNRKLRKRNSDLTPEQLVERVFERVVVRLRRTKLSH